MEKTPKIACLLRTYNNPHIEGAVVRALKAGIDDIVVMVNGVPDMGNTRAWLKGQVEANPGRIHIREMKSGYLGRFWSAPLNAGFDFVRDVLREESLARGGGGHEYVFTVSNEVLYTADHVAAMREAMEDETLGLVGSTVSARKNGNIVELGKSYVHPRNTIALHRLATYAKVGSFSMTCDEHGGQEDLDYLVRMEAQGAYTWRQLDLKVPLVVGVHYDQASKEARELEAIRKDLAEKRALVRGLKAALARLGVEDLVEEV